jgi:hypothetical protein
MSVLRSEFDEQRVSQAYDFVKAGRVEGEGIRLDIKPPMGANYFRISKAGVFWGDPSFDNSSSSATSLDGETDDETSYDETLLMKMHSAYQDVGTGDYKDLTAGNWALTNSSTC